MYIFLLSSVYPSLHSPKGTTPVVHYFTKEWVSLGHRVHVFHFESLFPKVYYWFVKPLKRFLDSKLGHLVPNIAPKEYDEEKDGVSITHVSLKKKKPHGRFSQDQIQKALDIISLQIKKEGLPDCFVGHWDNPQLELLHELKERFHRPTCLVYHSNGFSQLEKCYGRDFEALRKDIDLVGFRNHTSRDAYFRQFGIPDHSFIASSGISMSFVDAGNGFERDFDSINNFIYVGAIVARKYPIVNINALAKAYQKDPFNITYVGEGLQEKETEGRFRELNCCGSIKFTGRIPRDEVIAHLKEADVFMMISKAELFGLVYLEAMALGCITIGSRGEGIDGIIVDGVNGFLCEAGNEDELCSIINRIRSMSKSELISISNRAKDTARSYSDLEVAKRYIEELKTITAI